MISYLIGNNILGYCGSIFFTCVSIEWTRLTFIGEKLVLEKSESLLILFYFILKAKIK